MKTQNWYIGERQNRQFNKPYYRMYGQLTKRDAKKKEDCLYGGMYLTSYNTEEEYNNSINKLRKEGFRV